MKYWYRKNPPSVLITVRINDYPVRSKTVLLTKNYFRNPNVERGYINNLIDTVFTSYDPANRT